MDLNLVAFYTSFFICCSTVLADELGHVTITRQSSKNGLHRNIHTEIEWFLPSPVPVPIKSCYIMLIETIQEGMYVDLDETFAAVPFGCPHVISGRPFDVEKPAHHSEKNDVLVYPDFFIDSRENKIAVNLTLPVHLRYHKPQETGGTTFVHLKKPIILGCCEGLPVADGAVIVSAPCHPDKDIFCSWQTIKSRHQTEEEVLIFQFPVGNLKHTFVVTSGTLLVTAIGAAIVLRYILYQEQKDKIT